MYEEWQLQSWSSFVTGLGDIHPEVSWLGGEEKSSIAQPRLQCKGIVKQRPVLAPGAGTCHWGGLSVA